MPEVDDARKRLADLKLNLLCWIEIKNRLYNKRKAQIKLRLKRDELSEETTRKNFDSYK